MPRPKPKSLYRRRFLNRPRHQSSAHIIVEVVPRDERKYGGRSVDVVFDLMDCNRKVSLDFDLRLEVRAQKSRDDSLEYFVPSESMNALAKARLLRDTINEFVDRLEENFEWMVEGAGKVVV